MLVGFFFAVRMMIGLVSVRVLSLEARDGSILTLGLNFLLLGVVCFSTLGSANRSLQATLRVKPVRWVCAFLIISFCSLGWSSTAMLSAAVLYWSALAADVFIVVLLLRTMSAEVVSRSVMKGFIWGACCTSVVAWLMPLQPDLRLGDEDYFNANQIAFLASFAFFLAQYLNRIHAGRWKIVSTFLGITLLRSLSKTTIIAFVIAGAFLLIFDRGLSRRTKAIVTGGSLFLLLIFGGLLASYYEVYTNAGNQAQTLTGRTAIWAYVLNIAWQQPWLGHGFDSMWKVIPPLGDLFEPRHAENEVLQQFYAYGLVGVVLFFGLYGSLYRQALRSARGPLRLFIVSLTLFLLIRGLAEAEPFDLLLPLWGFVLLSTLMHETAQPATMSDPLAVELAAASRAHTPVQRSPLCASSGLPPTRTGCLPSHENGGDCL